MSLPALSKLIKEGTGNTFQELLMKKRFERAAELLIDTNLPVEEIALNVGYENQMLFSSSVQRDIISHLADIGWFTDERWDADDRRHAFTNCEGMPFLFFEIPV